MVRIVVLLKQVLAAIKEEGCLSEGITEIINELLTILVYRTPLEISEQEAVIFIRTLIQKINRFERVSSLGEIAKLILIYTILLEGKNFKKLKRIPKFSKARDWIPPIILSKSKIIESKTPDSRISFWNTLRIFENTSGVNFIGLNEGSNPWKLLLSEKLISLLGTSDSSNIIITKKTSKTTTPDSNSVFIQDLIYTNLR